MTIEEIVERALRENPPRFPDDDERATRAACLAVAKAVVEEAAKLAPHDLDCHDEDAPCENDTCVHGCDETCPQRRIRALAAQGTGGEKSDG